MISGGDINIIFLETVAHNEFGHGLTDEMFKVRALRAELGGQNFCRTDLKFLFLLLSREGSATNRHFLIFSRLDKRKAF